ncbi:uncharacterized protein MEPE_05360 [Melanopsichium pennsylvanicum]|uniref:Prokaryotic-type class I peptide chain release factors domain-containing protein n=1 Tax=Melanopsichium pennsylvanicum TaxID=63383 RepID=A0AAJ4XRP0_9BASI|nr:uncharacterized protein MEPE_05360 [Melanopsichium pennsylvanicum]
MLRLTSVSSHGLRRLTALSHINLRLTSTLSIVPPSPTAPREVPTPLLFLTASKWTSSPPPLEVFSTWISHFSAQGYQSLLLDLDPTQPLPSESSKLMELFEKEAINTLRDAGQVPPFPPIMISKGPAALIAQTYVSSRPLTALQLIDPPINNTYLKKDRPELLSTPLGEFDFEATFPVRVVWSRKELQRQQDVSVPWYDVHRIEHEREEEADESLDRYTFVTEEEGARETQEWLEREVGVAVSDSVELFEVLDESEEDGDYDAHAEPEDPLSSSLSTRSSETSSTQVTKGELKLPEWFTAGTYTLQPGSRKYPLTLDEQDLAEKFIRGSGPGGQAINKLSTNVQLTHLPTGIKLTCQETRSRDRNRELARRRMSLTLEKLVRGEAGGSRIDRKIEKERKKKMNKKKKQKKRLRDKAEEAATPDKHDSSP